MSKDIIGINLGSKNTVVGTYKKGVFEIVVSEANARSLPTAVSYNDNERNFAELSMYTNCSNFKRTIIYPNRWLGLQKNWEFVGKESKHAYIEPTEDKNGRLGFKIDYKGKYDVYTPECLMGLFFSKVKHVWLKENINTDNIVVSIPDYCCAHERKALVESIEIGGLNCTALLNESSAITLEYGFRKLKEFDDKKPRTVAFIDLGHSSCNIFFSQFTKTFMKVISVATERFCGGREFDYLIAQKLADDFEKKYGSYPMDAPKCRIRLIDTITKVRKELTVNKEISIFVDNLMEGEDLVYNLTRDEFEKIIKPTVKKFKNLCKYAIEKFEKETKMKIGDIHSIEMVGDTVRTPIILDTIKKCFGKEVSKTLVPDECIARGCVLYAMINSPYYTLQNFELHHYKPYTIEMEYPFLKDGKEIIKKLDILKAGINVPASKIINFTKTQLPNKDIIPFKFYYSESQKLAWLPNKLLKSYNIYLKKKKEKDWKFSLKYVLDINCIPKLEKAILLESKIELVPVIDTTQKIEEIKNDKKPEEKKDDKKPEDKKPEDKKKAEEKKHEEKPKMKEKKIETETQLDVYIVESLFGTSKGILEQYLKREKGQNKEDEIFREASRLKNSLEKYIYATKEKLDSQNEKKKNESIINELNKKISDLEKENKRLQKELNDKNEEINIEKKKYVDENNKLNNELNEEKNKYKKLDEEYKKYLEEKCKNDKLLDEISKKFEEEKKKLSEDLKKQYEEDKKKIEEELKEKYEKEKGENDKKDKSINFLSLIKLSINYKRFKSKIN